MQLEGILKEDVQDKLLYKRVSVHKSNTLRFYSGKHFVFGCI